MRPLPSIPGLLLGAILTVVSTAGVQAQDPTLSIAFSELFAFEVIEEEGSTYINTGPDSLPPDPSLHGRCTALWPYHLYLYSIFSETYAHGQEFQEMLPDTAAIRQRLRSLLEAETDFKDLYLRSIRPDQLAPLPIDSALRIAAHFYYLHIMDGEPTLHICVGINKVRELSVSRDHPHHAAFCYMTIWEMEDSFGPWSAAKTPFADELKAKPSAERIAEIEQEIYQRIAALPEMRQALIDTYERKKEHLNFVLLY
ncbi:MAG TPA: hypothetical protein PLN54_03800 [Flavobacteriales bacterium]|nr:hypothetical protein [Flavobacteriales bacterium]